eukprot:sb/3465244/
MFRKRKKERPMTYSDLMRNFTTVPPAALGRAQYREGVAADPYKAYRPVESPIPHSLSPGHPGPSIKVTKPSTFLQVKVGMRISPNPVNKESILSVDESKSSVLIANETLFFDYVHGPQSRQSDVCSSMLADALPAILHGRHVVVVTFGKIPSGRQFSLIGSRDSPSALGLVPTAVTWLNKLGEGEDRSKCGPNTVNITSLRLDEHRNLSEFVTPCTATRPEELGKYLDKLTLTLPARDQPNEEALIINMTFSRSKNKKKNKDNFGMLSFIDIGTPVGKHENALCWQWLQEILQPTGTKYNESFVQLRQNILQQKCHILCLGHITHSPRDYEAIGKTLNLGYLLFMRHLPPQKRNELLRLKKDREYSSATSTGEESADTVIYRPGLSDGEGPPKRGLPERTKGDGQVS